MEKKNLLKFFEKLNNFSGLVQKEQITRFAYYLQNEEGLESFKPSNIKKCYQLLDLPVPRNISSRMGELEHEKKLVPKGLTGFRLAKFEVDKIKNEIPTQEKDRIEKIYKPGQIYDFYKDIKKITLGAKTSVFVIDAYANEDVIELYLDKLPVGIKMMILTSKPQGNFLKIAQKFKLKHGNNFKVKTNKKCHDRLFFVDKKCFVIGQSIEKAAMDTPTYLCEVEQVGPFRSAFQSLYDSGKTLV